MQVPVELFVWLLAGLGGFLSIVIHLLIRIMVNQGRLNYEHRLFRSKVNDRFMSINRNLRITDDESGGFKTV